MFVRGGIMLASLLEDEGAAVRAADHLHWRCRLAARRLARCHRRRNRLWFENRPQQLQMARVLQFAGPNAGCIRVQVGRCDPTERAIRLLYHLRCFHRCENPCHLMTAPRIRHGDPKRVLRQGSKACLIVVKTRFVPQKSYGVGGVRYLAERI